VHQSSNGKLTFGVTGVNPYIFNVPLVNEKDNPILLGVSPLYLTSLTEVAVREMVRTIGRYMGIEFEEEVYKWLFDQYGGHPFFVRKVCSLVYGKVRKKTEKLMRLSFCFYSFCSSACHFAFLWYNLRC